MLPASPFGVTSVSAESEAKGDRAVPACQDDARGTEAR